MITDLTLIQSSEAVCEEVVLASIASFWGRRYEMIFSEMWNFKLVNTENTSATIGDMLEIKAGNILGLLEKYHGIASEVRIIENQSERGNFVRESLAQGHIICTFLKKEKVSWAPDNEKADYFPFIILGFESDMVCCIDVHFKRENVAFPISTFFQDTIKYMEFYCKTDQDSFVNWKEVLQYNVTKLQEDHAFEAFRKVPDMMRKNPHLVTDEDYRNEWKDIGLCWKLKELCRTRALFAETIHYLNQYQNSKIPEEIEQGFVEVSNQWLSLWSICTKMAIRKGSNLSVDIIADKFEEIAVLEDELGKKVIGIIRTN